MWMNHLFRRFPREGGGSCNPWRYPQPVKGADLRGKGKLICSQEVLRVLSREYKREISRSGAEDLFSLLFFDGQLVEGTRHRALSPVQSCILGNLHFCCGGTDLCKGCCQIQLSLWLWEGATQPSFCGEGFGRVPSAALFNSKSVRLNDCCMGNSYSVAGERGARPFSILWHSELAGRGSICQGAFFGGPVEAVVVAVEIGALRGLEIGCARSGEAVL